MGGIILAVHTNAMVVLAGIFMGLGDKLLTQNGYFKKSQVSVQCK